MRTGEPIQITFKRCKVTQRGLFVDSNFNIYSLNELLSWAERETPFVIVDESTGEDITRLILDHGSDAGDP
jgi:polyhydroxyalkanoate synthesis regulator protein